MIQLSAVDLRANYHSAKIMLIKANFTPRDANGKKTRDLTKEEIAGFMSKLNDDEITQGYLWTEATLLPARQVIQFPLIDTQQVSNSPITPTMRLLTMQDSFLITAMSYYLMEYSYTDGSQANPDFTDPTICWTPITYASTWADNSSTPNFAPGCAMLWIGAYLSLEVNKKVLIPYWDCYRHYKAPEAQATPAFPSPSNYIPQQRNQHDGSTDGFYPVEPNVIIGGGRGNILKLNLPANIPAIAPFNRVDYNDGYVIKAVVCVRGILMQNSTSVK